MTIAPAADGVSPLRRPPLITVLAVLHCLGAGLLCLAALLLFTSFALEDAGQGSAGLVGLLLGVLGALEVTCAIGLLKLRPYGRTLQLVFSWIGLIAIPIGTVISILLLVYFLKPGIKTLFSGKPVTALTPEERALIAGATEGSGLALVAVVIVVLLGAVMMVGIVAAVAIPGLLRARMAGNEASAESAFLSRDLSTLPGRSGYMFLFAPGQTAAGSLASCNGAEAGTLVSTFFVAAVPVTAGITGERHFGMNQAGEIYESTAPIAVTFEGAPPDATRIAP